MGDVTMAFGATLQSGATATGNGTEMNVGGLPVVGLQVTGITTATITFEGTVDGSNWVAVRALNLGTGAVGTTATADGLYQVPVAGLDELRARISAYTTGTITVVGKGVVHGPGLALTA